ncbi:MAG TPA: GcrA family cell cycle regulator [Roseomonas sp.]|nr:GcrA family cell cycle regulator [Roseomonas sp.]
MDWTQELIESLKALWNEGHSTAEIGRRLGVSKNAVVGKSHRLALPPRQSPIRRATAVQDPATAHKLSVASAPDPSAIKISARPAATHGESPTAIAVPHQDEARDVVEPAARRSTVALPRDELKSATAAPRSLSALQPAVHRRPAPCCWPLGEPRTPGFRLCGAPALPGKPYCAEHAALAYVRARDRSEDAA